MRYQIRDAIQYVGLNWKHSGGWIETETNPAIDKIMAVFSTALDEARENEAHKVITDVRKMLAFEGVLSLSVEKGFEEIARQYLASKEEREKK